MKEHIRSFHMRYSSLLPIHRLQNYGSYKALYVFALVDEETWVGSTEYFYCRLTELTFIAAERRQTTSMCPSARPNAQPPHRIFRNLPKFCSVV